MNLVAHAQNTEPFEGVMKWAITVDIVDSKVADSYQTEIQSEDNSEVNQAIKELEQQLKDPEMQEMLLENPTIKNSMLKKLQQLKAAQTTNQENSTNSIFPSALSIFLKNNNSFTKIDGGSMVKLTGNMLYLNTNKNTYFIKDKTSTYSVINDTARLNTNDSLIALIATTDTTMILDCICIKYILTTKENNEIKTSYIWITNDLPSMNSAAFRSLGFMDGNLHHEAFKEMKGIPMRIEIFEKGLKMNMEVSEISMELVADTYFTIPSNYRESPFGF
ncbi:DUF4412 domain-containing protein [Cytophaga hutchinsonii]